MMMKMTIGKIVPEPLWGLPSPNIEDDDIYEDEDD